MMSSSAVTSHGLSHAKKNRPITRSAGAGLKAKTTPVTSPVLIQKNSASTLASLPSTEEKKSLRDIPTGKIQGLSVPQDKKKYKVAEYKDTSLARGFTRPGGIVNSGLESFLNKHSNQGWVLERLVPQVRAFSPRTTMSVIFSQKA